jgi:hypothetical protein
VHAAGREVAAATRDHAATRASGDPAALRASVARSDAAAADARSAMRAAVDAGAPAEAVQRAYDQGVAAPPPPTPRTFGNPGRGQRPPPSRRPALEIAMVGMTRDEIRSLCARAGVEPPDMNGDLGGAIREAARRIEAADRTDAVLAELGAGRVVLSPGSIYPTRVPAAAPPALTAEERRLPWCPTCGSASGRPCFGVSEMRNEHPERLVLAERVAASRAAAARGRALAAARRAPRE